MGSGLQDLSGDVKSLQGLGSNPPVDATAMNNADVAQMSSNMTPSSESWLQQNGQNILQGAGAGMQKWGNDKMNQPTARAGGAGQVPQLSTPTFDTGFDPNFLLRIMQQQRGGSGINGSAFYGV